MASEVRLNLIFGWVRVILFTLLLYFCIISAVQRSASAQVDQAQVTHNDVSDQRLTRLETLSEEKIKQLDLLSAKETELEKQVLQMQDTMNIQLKILYIIASMLTTTVAETIVRLVRAKVKLTRMK